MNVTRGQLTDERVRELITELGDAGVIHEDEAGSLTTTRKLNEAAEVRKATPEPPAVSRAKVGEETKSRFETACQSDDTMKALAVVWEVLTGEDVTNSS